MSEQVNIPPDTEGSLARVLPLRPEINPHIVSNFLPITARQYADNPEELQQLFDQKIYADIVLRSEITSRPQLIIDTVLTTLEIAPDTLALQKENEVLDKLEEQLSKAETAELRTKIRNKLRAGLAAIEPRNRRRSELFIAQSEAQQFLEQQSKEASERGRPEAFGDLLSDIHEYVSERYGDTDILQALYTLRNGPLRAYRDEMIAAQRALMTMLFLRDFPQDDNQPVLDLGY